ncbi:MAG: type II toxin-antitoxin system Phd/YefM family antitoxin [Gammaproteobacteria bacterium]
MKIISARDANRHFSSVLREVATGETVIVTSRGKPVAAIAALPRDEPLRHAARQALLQRLRAQPATGQRAWTRAELYEDLA